MPDTEVLAANCKNVPLELTLLTVMETRLDVIAPEEEFATTTTEHARASLATTEQDAR